MKNILFHKLKFGYNHVLFTLHSSELMPGGSPTFKTQEDIENLYYDLNIIFSIAQKYFQTGTLYDYYSYLKSKDY